ncbi:MAG: TRAP transporter small permease subunit [Planctomycetota bacterium]|jgi:TRAP-type C4-dicarboxylate transport system permease small subunit|nr:TRAP transporter small permease subunit [Planctomycetota bacterium]
MKKVIAGLVLVQEIVGTILLAIFFVAIVMQIAARYLGVPLLWTEEVANYSFIWAVFMGASVMVYHRAHFSFTFFRDRFKGRGGAVYSALISAVLLFFTLALTWYGSRVAWTFWNYNWITLPWMKMGYTWLCLPIAGTTMSIYNLFHIATEAGRALGDGKEASA